MAQTDARAGFRLPWNSERSNSEQTETEVEQAQAQTADAEQATDEAPTNPWGVEGNVSTESEAPTGEPDNEAPAAMTSDAPETTAHAAAPRKQSKFMTDLTKAMQVAAEEARSRTLTQFQGEAKVHVEAIHARSTTEATELRRKADDDVAAVREWSKAEIARIRDETETRITTRKAQLEGEIDGHAAMIGREIEQVQSRVAGFEQEMEDFFTRLLAEEDPTHFATMAERLPEPPPFEEMFDASYVVTPPAEAVETETTEESTEVADVAETVETTEETLDEPAAETETPVDETADTVESDESTETVEADAEVGAESAMDETIEVDDDFVLDRESAFAAIQAAAEAAASAEVASDAAERAEAVADIIDIVGHHDGESDSPDDLRKAALGLTPDYDAAEAEAAMSADASGGEGDEIAEIGDDALAARLAGLVPGKGSDRGRSSESKSTQVVVVGLVSVASIASFKRHLGRLPGVQSVGVSSGPDGEFLFAVNHAADVVLRDAIPSMPSFQARVTGHGDGTLNVSAHDPESDN
jgi:hypothetical protein